MKVARRVLSPGKCVTFTGRKIVASLLRHQVRAPSHLTRRGRCWTHKASSPAHCRRGTSRCASPGFAKTGFANNCEYQGKVRIISSKCRAFRSKTSSRRYGEMHSISRSFDRIRTTLRRGDFPPTEGSAISPLRRVVRILKNFAKYCESSSFSRGFREVFARFSRGFFEGFHCEKHTFSQIFALLFSFRSAAQCSQHSHFLQLAFRSVFAKFRKSCFASFANTSFARFRKY